MPSHCSSTRISLLRGGVRKTAGVSFGSVVAARLCQYSSRSSIPSVRLPSSLANQVIDGGGRFQPSLKTVRVDYANFPP